MKTKINYLFFIISLFLTQTALASQWSSTHVLLLSGSGYKSVPSNSTYDTQVFTFEHVDGWKYGDNFFFVDVTDPNSPNSSYYSEFSPRLSLSKMLNKKVSLGFIKDFSLAGTWELGKTTNGKLIGLGMDWQVPGFKVFQVNLYQRFTTSKYYSGKTGSAPQATFVWKAPFSLAKTQWIFSGFLDYAMAEKSIGKETNIISSPRLMMDLGALWQAPKKLFLGTEVSYWSNKYGKKGINETVPQLAVQWNF